MPILWNATAQKNVYFEMYGNFVKMPTPFGNVPTKDLLMTRYEPDTSANAVVLLDNGFMMPMLTFHEGWKCYITCFKRVKILKKSAFADYGEYSIRIKNSEKMLKIKAQTINPDNSISMVSNFFNESNDFGSKIKFAFPNLQEGSILEYEYTMESKDMFELYPWYFQSELPVRHSELMLDIHKSLEYIYFFKGITPKQDVYKVDREIIINDTIYNSPLKYYRYFLDTLPAMKAESYMTTLNDYMTSLKFQLSVIHSLDSDRKPKKIIHDWSILAKELTEDKNLGQQFSKQSKYDNVWKAVKPLLAKAKTDDEKMGIVYKYISENMSWIDDYFSIYAQETLNDAFKKKKGNSGELNLMLIACLNEAGIKAFPLLVSTREHGKPYKTYPIARQFNHLLCYIEKEGKPLFLDAGNAYRPINVPRVSALNGFGWVLDKNNPRWVEIPTPTSVETTVAFLDLKTDGTLQGTIKSDYLGYSAVDERTTRSDSKNEYVKKEWAKLFPDIQLDSVVLTNKNDLNQPFQRSMNVTIPNAAVIADALMYIKPILKTNFDENPFKQQKRDYPVDLPYPISDHFVVHLTMPDGYSVEELPKDEAIYLKNNGGNFTYRCTKTDNIIQVKVDIELKQLQFLVDEYVQIKAFFEQIVLKKSELIVLKKTNTTTTKH